MAIWMTGMKRMIFGVRPRSPVESVEYVEGGWFSKSWEVGRWFARMIYFLVLSDWMYVGTWACYFIVGSETMRSSFVSRVFFFSSLSYWWEIQTARNHPISLSEWKSKMFSFGSHLAVTTCFSNLKKHPFILGDSIMLHKKHERMDRVFPRSRSKECGVFACVGGWKRITVYVHMSDRVWTHIPYIIHNIIQTIYIYV